jgi:hypothetical protein
MTHESRDAATLPPLPAPAYRTTATGGAFDHQQMRAYAIDVRAAERLRIAAAMRRLVDILHLPETAEYAGDQRHTERRVLLGLADATENDSWPTVGIGAPQTV